MNNGLEFINILFVKGVISSHVIIKKIADFCIYYLLVTIDYFVAS